MQRDEGNPIDKLKHDIADLVGRDYSEVSAEEAMLNLRKMNDRYQAALNDRSVTMDADTLKRYWYEMARLFIATSLPANFNELNIKKSKMKEHWDLLFNTAHETTAMKDHLVIALKRSDSLKELLKQQMMADKSNNAFLMAMRLDKNWGKVEPQLKDTHHGAEVALLMQCQEDLPKHPSFEFRPNAVKLNDNSTKK